MTICTPWLLDLWILALGEIAPYIGCWFRAYVALWRSFPEGSAGKESLCSSGDLGEEGSIPGWWRSPGGGKDNPLQYSCLKNSMDRGALWAKVHRVAESDTQTQALFVHSPQLPPSPYHFTGRILPMSPTLYVGTCLPADWTFLHPETDPARSIPTTVESCLFSSVNFSQTWSTSFLLLFVLPLNHMGSP